MNEDDVNKARPRWREENYKPPEDRFSDLVIVVMVFEKGQQVLLVIPQASKRRRCVFKELCRQKS